MEDRSPETTASPWLPARWDRQRAQITGLIDARRLDRAADLAHEHLADFPCDGALRSAITVALDASADDRLRRRALEFAA